MFNMRSKQKDKKDKRKILNFVQYELHIDPSFWSSLYDKKLNDWKLDDSEKECFIHVSVMTNTVCLDRSSLDKDEASTKKMQKGMLKVFNTKENLINFQSKEKSNILRSTHFFVLLVHIDLKQYIFDYFFALPTMFPSIPFSAHVEHEKSPLPSKFSNIQIIEENSCFVLPWMIRNDILNLYRTGQRRFKFNFDNISGIPSNKVLELSCGFDVIKYTGWKNFNVTSVNLSDFMNPQIIAEHNAELNLKLMMWKHEPDLPLDKLRKIKCLLLGAGTVGCSVARNLIAWGVREITFVDCATVSPSNPVRQNLYTTANIGKEKAMTAAENLKTILPSVETSGHTLDIPMPGHAQSSSEKDYEKLVSLVENCDVIFLSTDSREGRWLPILLAIQHKKPVFNIALGYESLVVQYISGENGCYFCTDPVGPRDTVSSRTIDEKCTITRPGISSIASALAVELFVDVIKGKEDKHQIRLNLTDMQFACQKTFKNEKCTCCSEKIISFFSSYAFIEEAKCNPQSVEDVTDYHEDLHDLDILSVHSADFEQDTCKDI